MESEHGGRGRAFPTDVPIENLIEYVKETKIDGGYLGGRPGPSADDCGSRH